MEKIIESDIVELKKGMPDDLEKEIVAFLNNKKGGCIYIGIADDGTIVGVNNPDNLEQKINNKFKHSIGPSTLGLYEIELLEIEKKNIIKINIKHGLNGPYYIKKYGLTPKGCFIRIGSSKEPMDERMIYNYHEKRVKNPLRELRAPRQNLTFTSLKIYYSEIGIELNDNFFNNLNFLTSEGVYNYLAYLFSDNNNMPFRVVRYLDNTKDNLVLNDDLGNTCLITVAKNILNRLKNENLTYAKIEYFGRKELKLFDYDAVKEIVINAIIHNNYSSGNSPLIEFYSDRLEITSYGGLPLELTEDEFFSGIVARRNDDIIKIFKDMDLMENIGFGVQRILKSYSKDIFKFFNMALRVSIKFNENPYEYEVDEIIEEDSIFGKIINFCKEPKSLNEIMVNFGYNDKTYFKRNFINPLLIKQKIYMTIPNKPNSRLQKYISR